jgi:hypothetical protein
MYCFPLHEVLWLPRRPPLPQRDVPGLTRGVLPVMASHGVRALTVGVNGFSAPPGVPKRTPFIWRDEESGAEVVAMWHEGARGCWIGAHVASLASGSVRGAARALSGASVFAFQTVPRRWNAPGCSAVRPRLTACCAPVLACRRLRRLAQQHPCR